MNFADDFVVCGKAPAEAMRVAVERMMETLRLPINATKTRCLRVPEEPLEFLGYRIGRNYSPRTGRAYIGTRPSRASVRSICRKISEATEARYGLLDAEVVIGRLNRAMLGWANYYQLGQVSPAYRALDRHAIKRLRQWLCRKHKVKSGKYVRFRTCGYGLSSALYTLYRGRPASRGRRHDRDREPDAGNPHVRFNERGEETWLGVGLRHRRCAKAVGKQLLPHATAGALLLDSTMTYMISVAEEETDQLKRYLCPRTGGTAGAYSGIDAGRV